MKNLINLVKSLILRNKGKSASIALILLLTFSSALAIMPTIEGQIHAAFPVQGATQFPASEPGVITSFAGGTEIVQPTAAQIALYNLPQTQADIMFTVAPSTVGIGQTVQIVFGLWNGPPTYTATVVNGVNTGTTGGWGGLKLTITPPNGSALTIGPVVSTTMGTAEYTYIPTEVGKYDVTFDFLGEIVNGTTTLKYAVYLLPYTDTQSFTVQEAPIPGYLERPVPQANEQWTLPVDTQCRSWYTIHGPWLCAGYNASTKFNPYTYAPNTGHILWRYSLGPEIGGQIGGEYGALCFNPWTAWVSGTTTWNSAIPRTQYAISYPAVVNGYLYYNGLMSNPSAFVANYSVIHCVSLTTGEMLWTMPGSENYAQITSFQSINTKPKCTLLWYINSNQNFVCYDGETGNMLFTVNNVPAGPSSQQWQIVNGPVNITSDVYDGYFGGGDLFVYTAGSNAYNNATWTCCWSSMTLLRTTSGQASQFYLPAPFSVIPWVNGRVWNTTVINYPGASVGSIGTAANGDPTLLMWRGCNGLTTPLYPGLPAMPWTVQYWCVDQINGALLWNSTYTVPAFSSAGMSSNGALRPGLCANGIFPIFYPDTGTFIGMSAYTGQKVWESQVMRNSFGFVYPRVGGASTTHDMMEVTGYGNFYHGGIDGYMHCLNMTTGVEIWASPTQEGGLQMPVPNYPLNPNYGEATMPTLADGKVYCVTGKEHELNPLPQGNLLYCWDAYTGEQLWNISGAWGIHAIADGIMVGQNPYDGMLAAFAHGPTQTTVSAPQTKIIAGDPVVIQGTVTDQSPALMGTPCVSDACMSGWMGWKLMDQPYPANAAGVTVQITAIDPNNNYISIANVTSDIAGKYSYQWTPPDIPGKYTIMATMPATDSYYSSSDETAMAVVSPQATASAPTTTPTSVADMYFVPAIAGVFVLIIVVAIVLALLMLRKRP